MDRWKLIGVFGAGPAVVLHNFNTGLFLNVVDNRIIQLSDGNHRGITAGLQRPQLSIISFFGFTCQVDAGNINFSLFRGVFSGMIPLELRFLLRRETLSLPRRRKPIEPRPAARL